MNAVGKESWSTATFHRESRRLQGNSGTHPAYTLHGAASQSTSARQRSQPLSMETKQAAQQPHWGSVSSKVPCLNSRTGRVTVASNIQDKTVVNRQVLGQATNLRSQLKSMTKVIRVCNCPVEIREDNICCCSFPPKKSVMSPDCHGLFRTYKAGLSQLPESSINLYASLTKSAGKEKERERCSKVCSVFNKMSNQVHKLQIVPDLESIRFHIPLVFKMQLKKLTYRLTLDLWTALAKTTWNTEEDFSPCMNEIFPSLVFPNTIAIPVKLVKLAFKMFSRFTKQKIISQPT